MEIPLNDEEMLDILGSLLLDEFYASEIWQPVPAMTKRKKAKARNVLFWEVARYHYVHGKDYPKQQARMRKLERVIMEQDYKLCEYSKEKNLNWVEEDLRDLYRLLEREPFSKNEGGFDMQAYIDKVLLLLPEDKTQEWRNAHPTKEDLLKKEVKIELPKRIPFPYGIQEDEKEILLFDVFDSLPFEEYVSFSASLFRLFLDSERSIKAFKLFSTDD